MKTILTIKMSICFGIDVDYSPLNGIAVNIVLLLWEETFICYSGHTLETMRTDDKFLF